MTNWYSYMFKIQTHCYHIYASFHQNQISFDIFDNLSLNSRSLNDSLRHKYACRLWSNAFENDSLKMYRIIRKTSHRSISYFISMKMNVCPFCHTRWSLKRSGFSWNKWRPWYLCLVEIQMSGYNESNTFENFLCDNKFIWWRIEVQQINIGVLSISIWSLINYRR